MARRADVKFVYCDKLKPPTKNERPGNSRQRTWQGAQPQANVWYERS